MVFLSQFLVFSITNHKVKNKQKQEQKKQKDMGIFCVYLETEQKLSHISIQRINICDD